MAQELLDGPADLGRGGWWAAIKRTISEFREDNVTDWAAALTYYGVLAIFPALIALVSVLGLIGPSATDPLLENLSELAPGPAQEILSDAIRDLQNSRGTAGLIFVIALAGALWSASSYVSAFMRASNSIYDIGEGRPIWKTVPTRIAITVVLLVLLAISAFAVVVTGGLASDVGDLLGVGSTAVQIWDLAKWPVLVALVTAMLAVLYWAAPNVKHPGFRWITPGGLVAVTIWIVASLAFALFVANFGSYNKTYGTLAGMIVFLIWLWISNVAILFGAELNAELERERAIEGGHPEGAEPFVEPRDTRKLPGKARSS